MPEWVNVVMQFAIFFMLGFLVAVLIVAEKECGTIARHRAEIHKLERELYEERRRNVMSRCWDRTYGANWVSISNDETVIRLKVQVDMYKNLYLDEQAKRLELAEQVRRLGEQAAE